jgi:hypothetical protein
VIPRYDCVHVLREDYGFLRVAVLTVRAGRPCIVSTLVEDTERGRRAVYVHPSQWPDSSPWPRLRYRLLLP